MPSKKKKYNARFPAGRIKKIMQTDEDVGKVAQAVPIIIYSPRTLELFVESLLTKTMQITSAKNAKTLSPSHMKQCILSESCFDFLKDLVKGLPDVSCPDDDVPTPPLTPAPQTAQGQTNSIIYSPSSITRQDSIGIGKEVTSSATIIGNSCQNFRDNRSIGLSGANSQAAAAVVSSNEINKNHSNSLQSSFQTTLSTSFNVSQPNFYTELNPINLSTNSNSVNVNIKPTSNYTSSTSIDEDYDT